MQANEARRRTRRASEPAGAGGWSGSVGKVFQRLGLEQLEEQAGRGVPAQCAALVAALRDVAARWSDVRCCQIAALDAIPPSQLGKLPGLFCYRDGALCHSLMGAEAVGAARSGPDLARTLAELGVLAPGAGAGGAVSDHESDDLDSD